MDEIYISVDIETAGPYPAKYAILSIGACLVEDISTSFYVELQPDRPDFQREALEISGLSLERLREQGKPPLYAMEEFAGWLKSVNTGSSRPVFVSFNASFDWMFLNDYFYRYLGYNPFGHSALDIKAYYMGHAGVTWAETSLKHIAARLGGEKELVHNALKDAQDQAELFREIRDRVKDARR